MKKRLIVALVALCLLAAGCATGTVTGPSSGSLSVYRELAPDYKTDGKIVQPDSVSLDPAGDIISQALGALMATPDSDKFKCPIPKTVTLLDAALEDNVVTVYADSEYLDTGGMVKTVMDACITLTMCSIQGVDFVSIRVGSEIIEDKLSSEDFLLFDNIISGSKAQVRVYFPKSSEQALGSEYRTISFDGEISAERAILDALFNGPTSAGLRRAFPVGTLVMSVYTLDGLCSVSLSGLDPADETMTAESAELSVYAIVNSLTALSNIKNVQILIGGQQVQTLWGFDISAPLSRKEGIIGSAATN